MGPRIIDKAWATDAEWGTVVWLTMVTGARRGEFVALRWATSSFRVADAFARWAVHPPGRGHASSPLPAPVYPLSR